jgi:aspartyl-tRNA(Asn)/glutamyl-tRNA(Gln) amidotransferase subunit A
MELAFATITQLKEKLARKEISRPELLSYFIKRFAQHDAKIKSALEIFDAESIIQVSPEQGSLAGIPGLVKDNICQKGRIASAGSKILRNYRAPYDATAIALLKQQGALLIGRANQDEFGMGGSNETSAYFPTHNPWDITRVPGGSGGGSAAAVAAGLVPFALGTETGGSVRQPAAFCGVVGVRTTYDIVSRYGVIAYGSSLDQIGVNTRTVYDNAMVLSAIAGHDAKDSTSTRVQAKDYTAHLTGKIRPGMKIGVITNALHAEGMDVEVAKLYQDALSQLQKLGAQLVELTIPTLDYSAAVYFILSRAEAASNLSRFDGVKYGFRATGAKNLKDMYFRTRAEGFGAEVRRRILIGNYVLSAGHADQYYKKACRVRDLMRHEFTQALKEVDVLFLPTTAAPAFKFGAFDDNRLQMDLQDYFTAPANLTGLPALTVPCGFTQQKLPIGFQLMGPALAEELLYQVGHAYEISMPWHTMHPSGF